MEKLKEWYRMVNAPVQEKTGIPASVFAIPPVSAYLTYKGVTLYRNLKKAGPPMLIAGGLGLLGAGGLAGYYYVQKEHIPEKLSEKTHQVQDKIKATRANLYDRITGK